MDKPDFRVRFRGTITMLYPLTEACREWIDENVGAEGWQWFGSGLAVEPRYLDNLLAGLHDAGFVEEP